MNFFLALKAMQLGKRVRRPCFADHAPPLEYVCIELHEDSLQFALKKKRSLLGHYKDGGERIALRMRVDLEDVEALDWEIVDVD